MDILIFKISQNELYSTVYEKIQSLVKHLKLYHLLQNNVIILFAKYGMHLQLTPKQWPNIPLLPIYILAKHDFFTADNGLFFKAYTTNLADTLPLDLRLLP